MAKIQPPANLEPHEIFRYGYVWDTRRYNDMEIELFCYKVGRTKEQGGLGKFGHFKRFVDMTWNKPRLNPTRGFIWNAWTERMIRSACDNKIVAW